MCAVGGDGTYHDVVNGMLTREDDARLPIAFIPNGSSNDLCSSLGILSIDHALEFIINGEAVKIDTVRVSHDNQ